MRNKLLWFPTTMMLVILAFGMLSAFHPVSAALRTEASPKIVNRARKCIISPRNQNSHVNVRARPNLRARIVGQLHDGVYVNVTRHSGGWVYINGSDQGRIKGWIAEIYISC